jgi:hypothetical protein
MRPDSGGLFLLTRDPANYVGLGFGFIGLYINLSARQM